MYFEPSLAEIQSSAVVTDPNGEKSRLPLLQAAIDASATSIGSAALHLRAGVKDVFMQWLGLQRPDLLATYEELYGKGAYAPKAERERLSALTRGHGQANRFRLAAPRPPRRAAGAKEDRPAQQSLF